MHKAERGQFGKKWKTGERKNFGTNGEIELLGTGLISCLLLKSYMVLFENDGCNEFSVAVIQNGLKFDLK